MRLNRGHPDAPVKWLLSRALDGQLHGGNDERPPLLAEPKRPQRQDERHCRAGESDGQDAFLVGYPVRVCLFGWKCKTLSLKL